MGTVILADETELKTIKISELPLKVDIADTDILPLVSSNVTMKIDKSNLVVDGINNISRIVFVGKDGDDDNPGSIHDPFLTIQAAIDYVYTTYGGDLSIENQVVIKVAPGIYEEQIHSYLGIIIAGVLDGILATTGRLPITIYNNGLDETHYPLRSDGDEKFVIIGINIVTNYHGVYGKLPKGNFQNCRFRLGDFIERDDTGTTYCAFNNCYFDGGDHNGFYFTGNDLTNVCNIRIKDCEMRYSWPSALPVFQSTHTGGWSQIALFNTRARTSFTVEGDWIFNTRDSYMFTSAVRNTFDTINKVEIINTEISNGLHFKSQPSELNINNCNYGTEINNLIPDGEADITADVDILCDMYSNNIQHNGISGNILIPSVLKDIGGAKLNRYLSLHEAIKSVRGNEVLRIHDDLIDLDPIIMPTSGRTTIEGRKEFSLTFIGDIVELGENDQLLFYGLSNLAGGNIEVNGDGSYIGFEECLTVNANVTLTSGINSYLLIYTSTLKAPTGTPAVIINSDEVGIVSGYSRVDGGIGNPAFLFNVNADGKFKGKFSTFLHGDKNSNAPFVNTSGTKFSLAMYNCGMNAAYSAAEFSNSIGNAGVITDPAINF